MPSIGMRSMPGCVYLLITAIPALSEMDANHGLGRSDAMQVPESAEPPPSACPQTVRCPPPAGRRGNCDEEADAASTIGRTGQRYEEVGGAGADLGRQGVSHPPCSWAPQTQRKRETTCEPE